jgi:hypothetical protein
MNFYVNSTSSVAHPEITFSATTSLPQTQTEQLEIKYIISGENTERSVYFSYSSTTNGSSGEAASLVDITASSQMFKSTDGGTTFSPDTIVLTPRFQTVTYSKWQYSDDGGSTYTHDVVSGQHGFTINNGVLTIAKTCDLFTDSVTALSFKCISSNANVYDTITIIKLYDTTDTDIDVGGRNYALGTGKVNAHENTNKDNDSYSLYTLSIPVETINELPIDKFIVSFDMTLSGDLTGTSGTPYISVGQNDSP